MQEEIHIRTTNMTVDTIYMLVTVRKRLILKSTYAHKTKWNSQQKVLFIESLLLGIPIPAFFLVEEKNGNFIVIDGLERLNTIIDFLENRLSLEESAYFLVNTNSNTLNTFFRKDLKSKYEHKILTTNLLINIIEESSVELNTQVFMRINSGYIAQ